MSIEKNDVVVINLDRPREIRFGHRAIKMLQAMGVDLENVSEDMGTIEKVMYCGLLSDAKANNETLKLEDMEELLDQAQPYSDIITKMELAFNAAFGQMNTDQKNFQRIVEK